MSFNCKFFSDLFRYSPRQAFEYRKRTTGQDIPVEYLTEEERKGLTSTKVQLNNEYDREHLVNLLKQNNIEFFKGAKTEKLVQICKDNGLI